MSNNVNFDCDELVIPSSVKILRMKLGMTQKEFSEAYGIHKKTLQNWEQGIRIPDSTALSYLKVIATIPNKVAKLLN